MVEENNLLNRLSVEEKVQLLSAVDWWRTPVIKKDGVFIPHIKVLYFVSILLSGLSSFSRFAVNS